jgi:transposase
MSLRVSLGSPIPKETVRVAHAAFPKGNVFMQMREVLGPSLAIRSLLACFPIRDKRPKSPRGWPWYW